MSERRPLELITVALGALVRLLHLAIIQVGLPFASGGLYLEFSRQILLGGFALPSIIPFYSEGGIPFAYPPLPFYVLAALLRLFPDGEVVIVNLLPPMLSILALPSFDRLTRQLGLEPRARLAALLAFAVMPAAFRQQITSAGLAEACGTLALIWLVVMLARADENRSVAAHALAGLAGAACLLASPGSAVALVPVLTFFAVRQLARPADGRIGLRSVGLLAVTGLVVLTVSAPYWWTVLADHGPQVFSSAWRSSQDSLLEWLYRTLKRLGSFQLSQAPLPVLLDGAVLVGFAWSLLRRRWLLAASLVAALSVPREGSWMAALPACLLAGIGTDRVLGYLARTMSPLRRGEKLLLAGALGAYLMLNAGLFAIEFTALYDRSTWSTALEAMRWLRDNLPAESDVVVLGDDTIREWVPHMAARTVLNVFQGLEWEAGAQERVEQLNDRLDRCRDMDCIHTSLQNQVGRRPLFLMVDRDRFARLRPGSSAGAAAFTLLWENSGVIVGRLSP